MRLGALAGCLLVAGAAHAQPGAPANGTAMETYRVEAREAALRGDCKLVATIARQVSDVDAAYYRDVFLRDTVVVSCNAGVGGVQLPPSSVAPSTVAPLPTAEVAPGRATRPPTGSGMDDTGRGVLGLLAGLGAGAIAGVGGGYLGASIAAIVHGPCSSFCGEILIPAVVGAQIGMNFGLALGITLVGDHAGGDGSFGTSFALGLAGSAVSWLFVLNDETIDNGMWGVAFFALPVAGTMTGYWITHEHAPDVAVVPTGNGVAVMGRF